MSEIDLMSRYPKSDRSGLLAEREAVTEADRVIARQFGPEYFDGPRRLGLGGYHYDPRFWKPVVADMIDYYGLHNDSQILDVGCGKGFMLYDFQRALPEIYAVGCDISYYCLNNTMPLVFTQYGSCDDLPYENKSFDLVVSIAAIHNLDLDGVRRSLREIMRVTRRDAYIKVNGYRTQDERDALEKWNLVAKTILHVNEWRDVFKECGYDGDYSFFTP